MSYLKTNTWRQISLISISFSTAYVNEMCQISVPCPTPPSKLPLNNRNICEKMTRTLKKNCLYLKITWFPIEIAGFLPPSMADAGWQPRFVYIRAKGLFWNCSELLPWRGRKIFCKDFWNEILIGGLCSSCALIMPFWQLYCNLKTLHLRLNYRPTATNCV